MPTPASIRTWNPGAMWPGPSATRYGSTGYESLRDGNRIALFPDPESGAAAQFDLLSRKYTGKRLSDAIRMWSGGNSSPSYVDSISRATGLSPDTVLDETFFRDAKRAVPFARAMARWEAGQPYPMDDSAWERAHVRFLGGPKPATPQPPDGLDAATYGAGAPVTPGSTGARMGLSMPQSGVAANQGLSPEEVSQSRVLARALIGAGTDTSPVQHWTQALARVVQGGVGGMWADRARQGEQEGRQAASAALQQALAGGTPNPAALANVASMPYASPLTGQIAAGVINRQMEENSTKGQLELDALRAKIDAAKRAAAIDEDIATSMGFGQGSAAPSAPSSPPAPSSPTAALPSVPGISVAPASPIVTGSIGTPGQTTAAPAPAAAPTAAQPSLRDVLSSRTPAERGAFLMAYRKDPAKAAEMLQKWINPDAEAEKAAQKQSGEALGKARSDLPGVNATSGRIISQVDAVANDPNLTNAIGPINSRLPTLSSKTADVEAKIAQLGGAAFLQAFESLKGGGQITEVEGAKATAAMSRLGDLRQSDKGYRKALKDFRDEVILLQALAHEKAKTPLPPALAEAVDKINAERAAEAKRSGSPKTTGAPSPGAVEGGYRFKGGDPANKNNWERMN